MARGRSKGTGEAITLYIPYEDKEILRILYKDRRSASKRARELIRKGIEYEKLISDKNKRKTSASKIKIEEPTPEVINITSDKSKETIKENIIKGLFSFKN